MAGLVVATGADDAAGLDPAKTVAAGADEGFAPALGAGPAGLADATGDDAGLEPVNTVALGADDGLAGPLAVTAGGTGRALTCAAGAGLAAVLAGAFGGGLAVMITGEPVVLGGAGVAPATAVGL